MLNPASKPPSTILYVAKDDIERELIQILRKDGFKVQEATTGSEALASVGEKPDLILLSVNLSDLSGFEVCRRLKADPALAAIPVLLMSARFTETDDRLHGLAAGADDYLIEPAEPAELLSHIKALLWVHGSEGRSKVSPEKPYS